MYEAHENSMCIIQELTFGVQFVVCPWIRNEELLDDMEKHGCHDIFW
jgi:hypothetical protein